MIPHPYEIPSTVRSRAARLAEAARTYYTARTGGARFRAWQEMQDQEEHMRTRTRPAENDVAAPGVRDFVLRHLLAWCETMERSPEEAEALRDRIARYLDLATNGGDVDAWAMAESFGWRWAMRRMEEWDSVHGDIKRGGR